LFAKVSGCKLTLQQGLPNPDFPKSRFYHPDQALNIIFAYVRTKRWTHTREA